MPKRATTKPVMNYQEAIVDGKKVAYSSDWILDLEDEIHFNYYWHQLSLIYHHCNRDEEILEIGVGTNFLSDILRRRKFKISTLDIDAQKKPDYCANALEFDYDLSGFKTLIAFEIFEHIPYETFQKVINKVSTSTIKTIIFSVPWAQYSFTPIKIKLPRVPVFEPSLTIPKRKIDTKAHFWELTKKKQIIFLDEDKLLLSRNELIRLFAQAGWSIKLGPRVECIQFFIASRTVF